MPTIEWTRADLRRDETNSGFTTDELHGEDLTRGYETGSLNDGLIAYYPFDNDADDGSTAIDSAQDHHGQINGAVHDTDSVVGDTSMSFDGTDDYIDSGNKNTPTQVTVTSWVYRSSTGVEHRVVDFGHDSSNNYGFRFGPTNNDSVRFDFGDGSSFYQNSGGSIGSGQWKFIAGIYNSNGDWSIYVDGSKVNSGNSGNGSIADGSRPLRIGCASYSTTDSNFDGKLDDVRIYNRALSQPEIKALYSLTAPSGSLVDDDPRENLVSHWKLDGTAVDAVGSNDGTVNGATAVDGFYNQCYSFDGTDDEISISDGLTNYPLTLSWYANFHRKNTTNELIHIGFDYSNNKGVNIKDEDGNIAVLIGDTWSIGSTQNIDLIITNEWHHYTLIVDRSGQASLYRDADYIVSGTSESNSGITSTSEISPNGAIDGKIDDVRIYDRALTAFEVQQLYEYGKRKIPEESNL